MKRLTLLDKMFLLSETREVPMHVGGVSLFTLPKGADATGFLHSLAKTLGDTHEYLPPFGDRLKTGYLGLAGKPVARQHQLTRAFAWATDISPTILSLTGVAQPGPRHAGRPVQPITGRDLTPLIMGLAERVYGPDDSVGYEMTDHGMLFQGDYKLVVNQPPVGDGQWRLFNIVKEPGEAVDLSASEALRFQRMLARYEVYRRDNKVVPVPQGYNQITQLISNTLLKRRDAVLVALLTLLLLLPFYIAHQGNRYGARAREQP